MSPQSQAIFEEQLYRTYPRTGGFGALLAAAQGHIGASRRLEVLLEEYSEAMADQAHHTPEQVAAAQAIADEMVPVRSANAIVAGAVSGLYRW